MVNFGLQLCKAAFRIAALQQQLSVCSLQLWELSRQQLRSSFLQLDEIQLGTLPSWGRSSL